MKRDYRISLEGARGIPVIQLLQAVPWTMMCLVSYRVELGRDAEAGGPSSVGHMQRSIIVA
jgi:hypothetical protein